MYSIILSPEDLADGPIEVLSHDAMTIRTLAPETPEVENVLTCEQRRAQEYGIEEYAEVEAQPLTAAETFDAERARDRLPDPREYADPLVFSLALSAWAERNVVSIKAAIHRVQLRTERRRVREAQITAMARTRAEFEGTGEGQNR